MIVVIDNYDSFTYNLCQYLGELGAEMKIFRNDKISVKELESLKPEKIVISPGPCTPDKAGISIDVIKHFGKKTPILGVCLGHQAIGEAYGGDVIRADYLMHGKTSMIHHDGTTIFKGVKNPFVATRYHSLIIKKSTCPNALEVIAWTDDDIIMGVKHKKDPVWGVQFHPESILTTEGKKILKNFLKV